MGPRRNHEFRQLRRRLVAGIAILRTEVLPRWVGACCIGGVVGVILAQGAYVALEVLWPLGTGLWFAATIGVVRTWAQHE